MTGFSEYITHGGGAPPKEELAAVLRKYPWFMTARVLLAEAGAEPDAMLALHQLSHPKREPVAKIESVLAAPIEGKELTANDFIDTFLSKGSYRIVPDENTPEYDAAHESAVLDTSDDMVSEELAEIYLAQGLNAQAKEIYARLSLLNPEKSVYFAAIISGL